MNLMVKMRRTPWQILESHEGIEVKNGVRQVPS